MRANEHRGVAKFGIPRSFAQNATVPTIGSSQDEHPGSKDGAHIGLRSTLFEAENICDNMTHIYCMVPAANPPHYPESRIMPSTSRKRAA